MVTRKRRDARPGKLSGHAMKQHATYCRAIFDAAIEWGWYKSNNPFRPPKQKRNTPLRIKASSRSWHHLTPAEFQRMLAVVPSVKRRAAFWLMYGAGLRPGEVYNLTIDRVNLAKRCVHIANRGATDDIPPFVVKCEDLADESKERTVPIPEAAIADVTSACQEAFKSGGFLALTPERFAIVQRKWRLTREGKRVWRGNRDILNNLLRDTKGYLRKAEIKLSAPFALTTLRKSYAQNHADAGTPPKTLAELLGHSDVQVTLKYYARVTDSNKRAAADTVNRLFSKVRGHEVATS